MASTMTGGLEQLTWEGRDVGTGQAVSQLLGTSSSAQAKRELTVTASCWRIAVLMIFLEMTSPVKMSDISSVRKSNLPIKENILINSFFGC